MLTYDYSVFEKYDAPSVKQDGKSQRIAIELECTKSIADLTEKQRRKVEEAQSRCEHAEVGTRSQADFNLLTLLIRYRVDRDEAEFYCGQVGKFAEREHTRYFETTYQAALNAVASETQPDGTKRPSDEKLFPIISARELDAGDYSTTFLVDGLLTNQNAILAAPSKSMKTTLCVDLALSLASGQPFAGQFTIPNAVSVLFMSGESGLATIQETARRIAVSKGLNLADLDRFSICDRVPWLFDPQHMSELENLLDERKPNVLICDPAYQMLDGSKAENMFAMGQQLAAIAKLCADRGILLIIIHHAKQTSSNAKTYSPLELGDIAWSGFEQFARQWILLSRREVFKPGSGDHKLWFSFGGSAGHSGLYGMDINEGPNSIAQGRTYSIAVIPGDAIHREVAGAKHEARRQANEVKRQDRIVEKAERIRTYVRKATQPTTLSKLKDELGMNSDHAKDSIQYLIDRGEVRTSNATIQNANRVVYEIIPLDDPGHPGHPGLS